MSKNYLAIIIVFILAAAGFGWWYSQQRSQNISSLSFESYWNSKQPSLMREVVLAAVDRGDRSAEAIIVGDALKGIERDMVRGQLLRLAFDPRWEGELRQSDRAAAITLATMRLLPPDKLNLPALADLHGAVILALVADLAFEESNLSLSQVSVTKLAGLPAPYGTGFAELERLGIVNMSEMPARAFAHIIANEVSSKTLESFFAGAKDDANRMTRLRILIPLMSKVKSLDSAAFGALIITPGILKELVAWFELSKLVDWKQVPLGMRLGLACGILPAQTLSFEHYADLLSYPVSSVAQEARRSLELQFANNSIIPVLNFILSTENKLTRQQIVSLLSVLRLSPDKSQSYITQWFDSTPDSRSVLRVMLARKVVGPDDLFNLEAARYLTRQEINFSAVEYQELTTHPEALARAMAYARLNVDKPEDRKLLEQSLKREPNQKLRNDLVEKLFQRP